MKKKTGTPPTFETFKTPAPDLHPDDWQLWRIPPEECRAALAHEIRRECFRPTFEATWGEPALAPWLGLPDTAAPAGRTGQSGTSFFAAMPPRGEQRLAPGLWAADPANAAPRRPVKLLKPDGWESAELRAVGFEIDPAAPRGDILNAFRAWLEANDVGTSKTRRGKRDTLATDRLLWLALYRLHRAAPVGTEYWHVLAGTEFQFWNRRDTPATIREMIARLGWFEKVEEMIAADERRLFAALEERWRAPLPPRDSPLYVMAKAERAAVGWVAQSICRKLPPANPQKQRAGK